jgi:hypothetical protein
MKISQSICFPSFLAFATVVWASIAIAAQTAQSPAEQFTVQFDKSREVSTQALKSAQAGDFDKAMESAHAGLQKCPAGILGTRCRALLNYTLGYVFQHQARTASTADDRERALNSATVSYKEALDDDPNNSAIHYNLALALSHLGKRDVAVTELQQAVQTDPQHWQYIVKLGDLYAEGKNWQGAMQAYEQATQSAPGADAPLQRILELTRRGHGLSAKELESQCGKWETLHPKMAQNCYEQFIVMAYANDNTEAEAALVRWLNIVALQDKVDERLLDALPPDWNTPALSPLREALRGNLPEGGGNWWTQPGLRSEVWARFLLTLGEQAAPQGSAVVERIWQTALTPVKNDPRSGSSLELRRALALLYVRYPDIDPNHRKLDALVEQIFVGKMQAIRSNDLEAQQRYHSVLGLIFADEQKWGSDGDSHGATFQLKSTLDVAGERYQREGIYQPLPEIKELLAKVYEKTNRPAEAAKVRWDTILAYMDSDQLDRAGQAIERFQIPDGFDRDSLNSLLRMRRDAVTAPAERKSAVLAQLSGLGLRNGISQEFLERQQFKTLADLVAGTNESESVQAALKAFSLAVEQHVPLVGVNDLSRWQAVQQQLVDSVGAKSEKTLVRPGGSGGSAELKLALPGSTVAQSVFVGPQTMQAARVAQVLGPERLTQYGRLLIFTSGKLAVPDTAMLSPEVRQRLETNGVKVVEGPH